MQRRLLTSMLGVAIAAVLAFGAGLTVAAVSRRAGTHSLRLSPAQVGLLALIALVVAAGLAAAQARRLARPVRDLSRAADRIGSGDLQLATTGADVAKDVATVLQRAGGVVTVTGSGDLAPVPPGGGRTWGARSGPPAFQRAAARTSRSDTRRPVRSTALR